MRKLTKAALWATCLTPVVLSLTMVRWAVVSDPSSFFVVWHIPFDGDVRVPDWMWVIPAYGTNVTLAVPLILWIAVGLRKVRPIWS